MTSRASVVRRERLAFVPAVRAVEHAPVDRLGLREFLRAQPRLQRLECLLPLGAVRLRYVAEQLRRLVRNKTLRRNNFVHDRRPARERHSHASVTSETISYREARMIRKSRSNAC